MPALDRGQEAISWRVSTCIGKNNQYRLIEYKFWVTTGLLGLLFGVAKASSNPLYWLYEISILQFDRFTAKRRLSWLWRQWFFHLARATSFVYFRPLIASRATSALLPKSLRLYIVKQCLYHRHLFCFPYFLLPHITRSTEVFFLSQLDLLRIHTWEQSGWQPATIVILGSIHIATADGVVGVVGSHWLWSWSRHSYYSSWLRKFSKRWASLLLTNRLQVSFTTSSPQAGC